MGWPGRLLEGRPGLVVVVGEQHGVAHALALAAQQRAEVVPVEPLRLFPGTPASPRNVGTMSTSETSASLSRGAGNIDGLETTSGTRIDSS